MPWFDLFKGNHGDNKKRGQIPGFLGRVKLNKNCMEFAMQRDSVGNFEENFPHMDENEVNWKKTALAARDLQT